MHAFPALLLAVLASTGAPDAVPPLEPRRPISPAPVAKPQIVGSDASRPFESRKPASGVPIGEPPAGVQDATRRRYTQPPEPNTADPIRTIEDDSTSDDSGQGTRPAADKAPGASCSWECLVPKQLPSIQGDDDVCGWRSGDGPDGLLVAPPQGNPWRRGGRERVVNIRVFCRHEIRM